MNWPPHNNALWDNPHDHIARESSWAVRRRLRKAIKTKWHPILAAWHSGKVLTTPLRHFHTLIDKAHATWQERQQNHNAFASLANDMRHKIQDAHDTVRLERQIERDRIDNSYLWEKSGLHFWNVIKHAQAEVHHIKDVIAFKLDSIVHPLFLRTHERKDMYRAQLDEGTQHHRRRENLLRSQQTYFNQLAATI